MYEEKRRSAAASSEGCVRERRPRCPPGEKAAAPFQGNRQVSGQVAFRDAGLARPSEPAAMCV